MISSDTLLRWLKQGKITAKTSPSGTCQRHRLGCQLLKTLLERTNSWFSSTDKHELSRDILAINTVFIYRMQGKELLYQVGRGKPVQQGTK
ncbi:17801_t:CDS:2 [Rhizophagus irregularis]|nr:17801_t:CDS:2 [Rhizophagus irregularis]